MQALDPPAPTSILLTHLLLLVGAGLTEHPTPGTASDVGRQGSVCDVAGTVEDEDDEVSDLLDRVGEDHSDEDGEVKGEGQVADLAAVGLGLDAKHLTEGPPGDDDEGVIVALEEGSGRHLG